MKSAKASPKIRPVYSKISCANLSPLTAASKTSLDTISSAGISLNKLGSGRATRNSRAVRATPVAEQ